MKILDIGCGESKTEGSLGMDIIKESSANIIADINKPLPFKDNTFDKIVMNHLLEHVDNVIKVMEELYRILRPKGGIIIRVPCFSNFQATSHPQHKHCFHHDSLRCLTEEAKERYTNSTFKLERNDYIFKSKKLFIPSFILNKVFNNKKLKHKYVSTILAYLFPADEILYVLRK